MPTLNGFRSFKGFRYYDSSSVALKTRINFKRYILIALQKVMFCFSAIALKSKIISGWARKEQAIDTLFE